MILAAAFLASLLGCGGNSAPRPGDACTQDCGHDHSSGPAGVKKAEEPAPPVNPLASPKESMRHQFELLKAGKLAEIKACLTPRLRDRVTERMVHEGAAEASNMSFEDAYDSEIMEEYEGLKTCKVKMKSGRTLTTLVLHDDQWLADTIWFR